MNTQMTGQGTAQTIPANKVNGVDLDTLKATIQAVADDAELGTCHFRARNTWLGGTHNRTTVSGFYGAKQEIPHKQAFTLDADEPAILAGSDAGANPVEHLLNALAACMTTSMVAHAAVQGIHIESVQSELEGDLDLQGFFGLSKEVPKGYTDIRVRFKVDANPADLDRLSQLTAFSPVLNTITNGARVSVQVESQ
jgi:uncharacterized OsmC-like protein